ncbi:MAG: CRISPR-associated protein Cas4 [Mangrovibacterium sp.]
MQITGTHFNYYQICHRKLWLFANGIHMESNSELVYEGKLLHENSYQRRSDKYKELAIDGIKIDYFDTKNNVVHEIKKSSKHEEAHEWQLKYYLYVLKLHGIEAIGLLEYPKQHQTKEVLLTIPDSEIIEEMLKEIESLINSKLCPNTITKSKCRNCSYFDFCYSEEEEE